MTQATPRQPFLKFWQPFIPTKVNWGNSRNTSQESYVAPPQLLYQTFWNLQHMWPNLLSQDTQHFEGAAQSTTKYAPFSHLLQNLYFRIIPEIQHFASVGGSRGLLQKICRCLCKATGQPCNWECLPKRNFTNRERSSRKSLTIEHWPCNSSVGTNLTSWTT